MTFTLDVRGDMTLVNDDHTTVAMVRPGPDGIALWASWARTACGRGYELAGHHDTREQALAACGWREVPGE